jgi:paraquat-inducible protein B
MSQKPNPAAIGIFIVTGLALGVAGLLVFSSSRLFTNTREYVLYFDSSLNGLNQGAPVKYRGVTIGSVKRVMIHFNQATNDFFMPVLIELQDNLLRQRLDTASAFESVTNLEDDIQHGLRGSLEAESLVTGVLYVDLDTVPGAPPPIFHQLQKRFQEIPTRPTRIQQLLANIAKMDIEGLEKKLDNLIGNLDATLANLNVNEMSGGITNLIASLNRVINLPDLTNTLKSAQTMMASYEKLADKLNSRVDPLVDSTTNTLAEANQALGTIRNEVRNLGTSMAPDSPLRDELRQALEQLAQAGQSISALADFLQRHPNALLTGRENPKKKP